MNSKIMIVDADHQFARVPGIMWLHWLSLPIPPKYEVVSLRSSTEALAALQSGDAFILVVIGSEVSGHMHAIELVSHIGRVAPEIPIIFVPYFATENYRAACEAAGATLITKHARTGEYEAAVEDALSSARARVAA